MKIKAYAKINIMLDIVEKRPDGYHNVDMIMQTVGLCDIINVEKILRSIELSGTGHIPYDQNNLVYKAAKLFFDVTGIRTGARIHLTKNIPVCAGMAGGSTDAAAVLRALNILHGKPLSPRVLAKISARLGADVPYCLMGHTARATGIGDIITPITPMRETVVLIVKPPIAVSTPMAYGSLKHNELEHPDTKMAVKAIQEGNMEALYSLMGNSFEKSIFDMFPEIGDIKARMLNMGASAALMSGSGSAVFGFFENQEKANAAYESFRTQYKEVFLTQTV